MMGLPRFAPPRPRHGMKPAVNTLRTAIFRASRLSPAEVEGTMATALACFDLLRTCRASEDHLIVLRTQLFIALGIEKMGVVRGLFAEIDAAIKALDAIESRSLATGAWRQSALYPGELQAIREGVRWHAFQLEHVSSAELHAAAQKLIAQTQSSGGELRVCAASVIGLHDTTTGPSPGAGAPGR